MAEAGIADSRRQTRVQQVPEVPSGELEHLRRQYPVGHGFFHAGQLLMEQTEFNYVFDCGAKRRKNLEEHIAGWRDEFAGQSHIDLLVISHLHDDHVNGCDQLLALAAVDNVVLPYLSALERILLVSEAIATRNPTASDIDRMTDPVGWFRNRGAGRVYLVRPAGPTLREGGSQSEKEWTFGPGGLPPAGAVITMDHAVALQAVRRGIGWEFAFHVSPPPRELAVFERELHATFDPTLPNVADGALATAAQQHAMRRWVLGTIRSRDGRDQLRRCYEAVAPNLNWTSLSMYTAPWPNGGRYDASRARIRIHAKKQRGTRRVGWLGTGDSVLKQPERCISLLRHFFAHRPTDVATLALPHHGSRHNFNELLLERTNARTVFVTCDRERKRQSHPHPKVVATCREHGVHLVRVMSTDTAGIEERYTVVFG